MMLETRAPLPPQARARTVTAVLGPTNTGKTHLAIDRMLAHRSGLIGLPLRLLAREIYQRVKARVGEDSVALVTGEEKIVPKDARYWVATAEAMPQDQVTDFVAIDEVQLAGDLERGRVFTDRILRMRGEYETLLLGAATARPLLEKLLPGLNVVTRPRMSVLAYAGDRKITRLPPRSAVVAFSANEVYAIAELIRRQRGGTAIVMGALSPRTRNAQVELFQSGDVDFLIATDAIGMGLNLDVDHVAFASDRKFDGYQYRRLTSGELAQIAGRAGRHTRDGTFGVTARVSPFEDDLVEQLETHTFPPVKVFQWRNAALDYATLDSLRASLDATPAEEGLTRAPPAEDVVALDFAMRRPEVVDLADTPAMVERLWEVCQIPDYRKIAPANHGELVLTLFGYLARDGRIPDEWFARQVRFADRADGDIDTLSNRIAHIRTWTYIANRNDWLDDPHHWRGETREIEDRLSDALHERLMQRFVDRRTSVLMKRLRENKMLDSEVTAGGDVIVEGHKVGQLMGFRFVPETTGEATHNKALRSAAAKALASELDRRAEKLADAPDPAFALASDGVIRWQGEAVARLVASDDVLAPNVVMLADEGLSAPAREKAEGRIRQWLKAHVEGLLAPLFDLRSGEGLEGVARGIAFQVADALGLLARDKVAGEVKGLDQGARASLRAKGIRFGAYNIFVPALLKPAPSQLIAQLWSLKNAAPDVPGLADLPQLSASGRTSIPYDPAIPAELYRAVGFQVVGARAVRVDILERLADQIRPLISWKPVEGADPPPGAIPTGGGFLVTVSMTSLLGCSGEDFASVLKALGYRVERRPARPEEQALVAAARAERTRTGRAVPSAAGQPAAEAAGPSVDAGDPSQAAVDPAPASTGEDAPATPAGAAETAATANGPAADAETHPGGTDLGARASTDEPAGSTEDPATALAGEPRPAADGDAGTAEPDAPAEPAPTGSPAEVVPEGASDAAAAAADPAPADAAPTDEAAADAAAASDRAGESDAVPASAASGDGAGSAEPEEVVIEIWRPQRSNRHHPQHGRARGRGKGDGAAGGAASGDGDRPRRRGGRRGGQQPSEERAPAAAASGGEAPSDAAARGGKGDQRGRDDRKGRRQQASGPRPQRRDRQDRKPDADSPFAALARLKEDLEKQRRGE